MYQFTTILISLFAFFLSAFAAPLPEAEKRWAHTGRGTWYYPGLGACGHTNGNNDAIVAMSLQSFSSSQCGQWVYIVNPANGQGTSAQIVDACESCDTNSLDMSPGVFQKLASLDQGEISIQW